MKGALNREGHGAVGVLIPAGHLLQTVLSVPLSLL